MGHSADARWLLLDSETGKSLVEFRHLTTAIDDPMLAGPGRVRLRVDIQTQRVAGLAVAGPGRERSAVGHHDGNLVIFGVDTGLDVIVPRSPAHPHRRASHARSAP